ncbi:MAG: hypothetical protein IJ769_12960 [Clostridia bacterium]|nr:hypothetical protein [Clostridia bacterium]
MIVLYAVIALILIIAFVRGVYLDQSGWKKDASPDVNAVIVDKKVESSAVRKSRYTARITFTFSDGFYYISNDYVPAVPASEVKLRQKAIEAHRLAVQKKAK